VGPFWCGAPILDRIDALAEIVNTLGTGWRGARLPCTSCDERHTGPKLSTFEEDVLLAVLALLKTVEPTGDGKPAWNYTGPCRRPCTGLPLPTVATGAAIS